MASIILLAIIVAIAVALLGAVLIHPLSYWQL